MKKILVFMLGVLLALPGIARDFTYEYEGQKLTYTVLSESDMTCMPKEGDYWAPGKEYTTGNYVFGDLVIPSIAKDGDVEFSVTRIGEYAFCNDADLTSVSIPSSVNKISRSAFCQCRALKDFTIEDGDITLEIEGDPLELSPIERLYIGRNWVVKEEVPISSGIKSVEIGNSVTALPPYAFSYCRGLTSVTIPNSVRTIGNQAFEGCSGLTSVTIPNSVRTIGYWAFSYCTGLTWITIPNSVTEIGNKAFEGCTNLFSALLLMEQCSIGNEVFPGQTRKIACYEPVSGSFTNSNKAIWVIEDGETVDAEKGIIWAADKSHCWVFGNYSGELRIPDGMTQLLWRNFAMCPGITEVFLPKTLETIGADAFNGTTIKEVVIPNRVTTISDQAFNNCNPVKIACPDALEISLEESASTTIVKYDAFDSKIIDNYVYSRSGDVLYYVPLLVNGTVTVPETVTSITDKAFAYCPVTEIVLPEKLDKLGERVWEGCDDIKTVVCKNTVPVKAPANLFTNKVYDSATLYVPKGCTSVYANTVPWKYFSIISEEEYDGVDNIISDENNDIDFSTPVQVYNLQGVMVSDTVNNLANGIYIVRQGNNVKKIAVR
ncbi:MAG: leucine-rich repeat domain-containing protein [Candidatus Cryptobacteroides sp.]